jgi:3-methyladenine DNA glycosylase/8-oxoguanine DNA glycosylase
VGDEVPARRIGELALRGGGGEPVDFRRTLYSHGVASLPPQRIDEERWTLEATLAPNGRARTVVVEEERGGTAALSAVGRAPGAKERDALRSTVRHMLRLDEDMSAFYALAADDPALTWAAQGAGRMLRCPTVFEDVVKTICTTNCAWSATERMVGAFVAHLGAEAPDGRRAFPTPEAMAEAGEDFYRDVARAGYRGAYFRQLAADVAAGAVDLEALNDPELPDDEVAARLLALPGVGPYATAHVMLTSLGRYSRLVLDSWTRPTYARLAGKKKVADRTIERTFRRYGRYAGLAFWLSLTRGWVDDQQPASWPRDAWPQSQ